MTDYRAKTNRYLLTASIIILCQTCLVLPISAKEFSMPDLHKMKMDQPNISHVLFHPRPVPKNPVPNQAQNIDLDVAQDVTIGCRLFTSDRNAPVILFFHGNGETVPDYDSIGPMYTSQGINFLITDYRGYGWSTGQPSASTLLGDARTIYREVTSWLKDNDYTGSLFIMGRSMGSACAIDLAAEHDAEISGLIIESGFAETLPLALTLGIDLAAMGITEDDSFNNSSKISSVTKPTFILHGQRDSLIPVRQAEKLHAACSARTKELQVVPGADHNTLIAVGGILYFQAIGNFINKVTGKNTWRERRKRFSQQKNH